MQNGQGRVNGMNHGQEAGGRGGGGELVCLGLCGRIRRRTLRRRLGNSDMEGRRRARPPSRVASSFPGSSIPKARKRRSERLLCMRRIWTPPSSDAKLKPRCVDSTPPKLMSVTLRPAASMDGLPQPKACGGYSCERLGTRLDTRLEWRLSAVETLSCALPRPPSIGWFWISTSGWALRISFRISMSVGQY